MVKLVVAYIVEKDEDVFPISYDSIKEYADKVVVIDGNPDNRIDRYAILNGVILKHDYEHEYKGANGKQRNHYLEYLKKHHMGDWCLVLDADEVVDHPQMVKQTIEQAEKEGINVINPEMVHFIGNFGFEDATQEKHYVPRRLFKVTEDLSYDEVEHPVLKTKDIVIDGSGFKIYHLAYAREMIRLRDKYLNHKEKSNIHTPEYLRKWYLAHLFGQYPIRPLNMERMNETLPSALKKHFLLEELNEEMYFQKRKNIEGKHFIMVSQWINHLKPKTTLDVGCGMGHYTYAITTYGVDAYGFDISKYAINNSPYRNVLGDKIWVADCMKDNWISKSHPQPAFDVVLALDILEHLPDEQAVGECIEKLYRFSKEYVLASIPVEGDPNLYLDETHTIFKSKEWWIEQFTSRGMVHLPTPDHFAFKEQIFIFKVNK